MGEKNIAKVVERLKQEYEISKCPTSNHAYWHARNSMAKELLMFVDKNGLKNNNNELCILCNASKNCEDCFDK